MGKNMYRYFKENKGKMFNKHMKSYLTQLELRKMQIKTARYSFTSIRWANNLNF